MPTYVALLRGVNVGGNHRLPMQVLVELVERAGARDVRTYIQSGNVVFSATAAAAKRLPAALHAALRARVGFDAPITTRTAAELAAIARDNPFLAARVPHDQLHVSFLGDLPAAPAIAALGPGSPPDAFAIAGREIFLHLPGGVARSKLTAAYFDRKLATTSTMRNWATVLALRDLANG